MHIHIQLVQNNVAVDLFKIQLAMGSIHVLWLYNCLGMGSSPDLGFPHTLNRVFPTSTGFSSHSWWEALLESLHVCGVYGNYIIGKTTHKVYTFLLMTTNKVTSTDAVAYFQYSRTLNTCVLVE